MEEFLDEDLRARRAELVADEHVVDGGLRLLLRLRHDHALAGGESVRLDDDRKPVVRERRLRLRRVRERLRLPGRDAGRVHHLLGEALRPLHARTSGDWAERGDAQGEEAVDEPLDERRLGSDDDKVGIVLTRPFRDAVHILRADGDVRRNRGGPGVPRRTEYLVLRLVLREPPRNRVFASAAAYYQDLHDDVPFFLVNACPGR